MKYAVAVIVIVLGFWLTAGAQVVRVFTSEQVGTNPINGYCLTTNGATSTWAPCGTGGSGTPGGGNGQLQFNSNGTFAGTSSPVVGFITATSGTSTLPDLLINKIRDLTSAGLQFFSNNGTPIADFGAGGGSNATFYGGVSINGQTRIATNLTGPLRADSGIISTTTIPVYLASTTPWTAGQLARVASNGALSSVATSALAQGTGITISNPGAVVGTGTVTIAATLGTDISAAEIANGDHGFFSYTSGVASLDSGGLTSANVATAVTDETGTGNLVFSAAPTFTGTTTLANLSVTGNAAVTSALTVIGTTTLTGYTRCGTGVPPNLEPFVQNLLDCWGNDPDGAYAVVGNTNSGGNAYSAYILNNNDSKTDGSNYGALLLYSTTFNNTAFGTFPSVANALSMENSMGPLLFMSGTTSNSYMAWATNGTDQTNERMRLTNVGNLGIGTTSPSARLTISGDMRLTGRFADSASSTGAVGSVLTATANGTQWLATSSLGIVGGGGSSLSTTTLNAGFGITFSGGTPVIIGTTPITIESTGGGGGGGALSTTTDIVGDGGASTVSFVTTDVMFGGGASTTAEFLFDKDGGKFILSSTTANATATFANTNSALSVQFGVASTTGAALVRGVHWAFASTTQAVTNFIGSITEWVIQVATTIFRGNVRITGNLSVATTTYFGATTTDALVVAGYTNSGDWIEEFCTSPMTEITQVAADTLNACGNYNYLEDANGVIDFVRPTTGSSTYFRIRPGATGVTTAAGDGMAIGWADGFDMGDLQRLQPVMEFALKQDTIANATSTLVFAGITDKVSITVDVATEPGVGFYVYATSTANWLFACNPATGGTTYIDTGIASSSFATGNNNPWTHFRLEVGGTVNTAVTGLLKARRQSNQTLSQVGACSIDLAASTAAAAPIVAIGKTTIGNSPELHVSWIKMWYLNLLY